mgnify:CR=1 FL=1
MRLSLLVIILAALLVSPTGESHALGAGPDGVAGPVSGPLAVARVLHAQSEQDRAREEMLEGKILSYSEILRRAQASVSGRVVGQTLQRAARDRWVYKIKILQEGGKVASVTVDAHSGRILAVKGKR